jgi:UDP-glucose 4-epimerase
MKILVSGGAGFIGSHLTDALVRQGHDVTVVDNLSTGRLENLQWALASGRVRFLRGDVRNRRLLREVLPGVERVFHLAASVGVRNIIRRPLKSLMNNIQGAASILQSCSELGGIKVVLFSSSEIYGKGRAGKLSEDSDSVLGATEVARWSYAASKVIDEFMALGYGADRGLPVVVVRCFNTCGPRQVGRFGMVLPRFIHRALRGEPLSVYGDGQQSRCFSYVGDVVRGVLLLADTPEAEGDVFNIGNDQETTILDLAERVIRLSASPSKIRMIPYTEVYGEGFEDVRRRVPSLERIHRVTGFRPMVDLETLLVLTIRDLAHRRGFPVPSPVLEYPLPELLRTAAGSLPSVPA